MERVETQKQQAQAPAGDHGRWSTIAWLSSAVLLVGLIVAIWLRVGGSSAGADLTNAIVSGDRPPAPAMTDRPIPDTEAPGLPSWYRTDGRHQVASDDGKVLVVNFWASWCGPCRDEAPAFRRIAREYEDAVHVVGLNAGAQDLMSDARAFVDEFDLDFTVVRGGRVDEERWGVRGFPETFVVGTDGRISAFVNGPIDEETLRGLLDAELARDRRA